MAQKQWLGGLLRLCAGLVCWLLAAGSIAAQQAWFPAEILRYQPSEAAGFSQLTALRQELAEGSGAQVAAYAQRLSQKLTVPMLESGVECDVLYVDGESALIWDVKMLAGEPLHEADRTGCILSRDTAMLLFGSIDIAGQIVRIDGQDYEVRGVYEPPTALASFGADPGRALVFASAAGTAEVAGADMLHFAFPGLSFADAEDAAVLAMADSGVDTGGSFADDQTGQGIRRFLIAATGLWLLLAAWYYLLRTAWRVLSHGAATVRAWRLEKNPDPRFLRRFLWCTGAQAMLFAAVLAALVVLPVSLATPPASYLPTRWSDFSFWPQLAGRLSQALATTRITGVMRPLLEMQSLSLLCVGFSIGALVCCISGAHRVRHCMASKGIPPLAVSVAASAAMGPLGGFLCRAAGFPVKISLFQLCLTPLLLLICFLYTKTARYAQQTSLGRGDA